MIRPWHFIILLAAACLGASAFWWQTKNDAWNPPPPLLPELPQAVALPLPVAVAAPQARARPLLWSSRRPVEVKIDKAKSDQQRDMSQSRLLAVLETGGERVALLRRQDGAAVKLTAQTRPWRVESFDGRLAVFSSGDGQRVELALERSAVVQNPAASRVAPRAQKP